MSDYSSTVLQYFFQPTHLGELDLTQVHTKGAVRGQVGVCDVLQLHIQINDQQVITDAKFKVYGNPYAMAAMAWLTEQLIGCSLIQARQFTHRELVAALDIPPTKLHTALQVEDILYEVLQS